MKKIFSFIFVIYFTTLTIFAEGVYELKYSVKPSGKNDFAKCKMWLAEVYKGDLNKIEFEDKDLNIIRYKLYDTDSLFLTVEILIKDDDITITYKDCFLELGGSLIKFELGNKRDENTKPLIERLQEIIDTY